MCIRSLGNVVRIMRHISAHQMQQPQSLNVVFVLVNLRQHLQGNIHWSAICITSSGTRSLSRYAKCQSRNKKTGKFKKSSRKLRVVGASESGTNGICIATIMCVTARQAVRNALLNSEVEESDVIEGVGV